MPSCACVKGFCTVSEESLSRFCKSSLTLSHSLCLAQTVLKRVLGIEQIKTADFFGRAVYRLNWPTIVRLCGGERANPVVQCEESLRLKAGAF